jgi:signal transduction histidine kinase
LFSLRWKLGGALLLVVLVSVGILSYLTNQNTTTQFQQYIQTGNKAYAQRLASNLEQYYTQGQSWNGVQDILTASLRTYEDRLVLADNTGKVVGDTSNQLIGKPLSSFGSSNGNPILVDGQTVGTLFLDLSGMMGSGRGYMGGRSIMSGPNAQSNDTAASIQPAQGIFLSRINNYIWIAGIIAVVVALLIGIFLTRHITRPIRSLTSGAAHISKGDLSYRVKVHANDEIGKLAESFNEMAKQLDNSEQSRRRLVSDVAHELRTPLTIIQGTVDGIADGIFQPDREHLDSIREQTVLLTHLVNDLRDLSMAESGQLKLERLSSDMVDLIQKKLAQFEVNARQKNVRLTLETQSTILPINIDAKRIEQVIGNLLSNAIRHTPEGGQITVSVKPSEVVTEPAKNSLIVSVADTGEGIPADNLPHIFERFYRVETSRSRSEGGAGLGLAIVKQMVEAHGGRVWVQSMAGEGSTFYFSLPYVPR